MRKWLFCVLGVSLVQVFGGCNVANLKALSSVSSVVKTVNDGADTVATTGVEVANTACPSIASGDFSKLELKGSAAARAETKAFLSAVHNMNEYTIGFNRAARDRCKNLGVAVGLSRKNLEKLEHGPYGGAEEICGAVGAQFERGSAKVEVSYQAGACVCPLDEAQSCFTACGNELNGPALTASCKGGKISGTCAGSCKGACEGQAHVACRGGCDGTCSGSCDQLFHGTCAGTCTGSCDGAQVQGPCQGTCEGSCDSKAVGSCKGTCQGDCAGACTGGGETSCDGKCSGECQGKFQALTCDGKFDPPTVSSGCYAACTAQAASTIKCSKPSVAVKVSGQNAPQLKSALEHELPGLMQIALDAGPHGLSQLEALVSTGGKLESDLGSVGGEALTCVVAGITLSGAATARLTHTVEASVKVKAMAGGKI